MSLARKTQILPLSAWSTCQRYIQISNQTWSSDRYNLDGCREKRSDEKWMHELGMTSVLNLEYLVRKERSEAATNITCLSLVWRSGKFPSINLIMQWWSHDDAVELLLLHLVQTQHITKEQCECIYSVWTLIGADLICSSDWVETLLNSSSTFWSHPKVIWFLRVKIFSSLISF